MVENSYYRAKNYIFELVIYHNTILLLITRVAIRSSVFIGYKSSGRQTLLLTHKLVVVVLLLGCCLPGTAGSVVLCWCNNRPSQHIMLNPQLSKPNWEGWEVKRQIIYVLSDKSVHRVSLCVCCLLPCATFAYHICVERKCTCFLR